MGVATGPPRGLSGIAAVYDRRVNTDVAPLRPQAFGRRNAKQISDPIIEPLWRGERVLVEIANGQVTLRDEAGEEIETEPIIVAQLEQGAGAESIVIDGYLTHQATQSGEGLRFGAEAPTAGQMASQMFIGRGLKSRSMRPVEEMEARRKQPDTPLAFVAIDLIALDGQLLFDIPLLERKRLLESVLAEGDRVRRSAYVRPPVDPWLASWRALGFSELAYKSANGRYRPGSRNDDWAIARIPPA